MNKEQATIALKQGNTLIHKSFHSYQWIKDYLGKGTHILRQDGSIIQVSKFWDNKITNDWHNGWSIR